VTLRYEQAIFLPDKEEVAANLVAVTLGTVVMISALSGAAAWLAARRHILPPIAEGLRSYLWLVPISMCGGGLYQTLSVFALRQRAYSRVTTTKLTQIFTMLGTQTLIGVVHRGPFGLLLGDAVGRMNGSLGLARLSWNRGREVFRLIRWKTMWSAAFRCRLCSAASCPGGILRSKNSGMVGPGRPSVGRAWLAHRTSSIPGIFGGGSEFQ
jgi:O-antigen/teichoic acid export membrane protein